MSGCRAGAATGEPTDDPATQLSVFYLNGIGALRERVWRVRSGLSLASAVLHRTSHVTGSTLFEAGASPDTCRVFSPGAVHVCDPESYDQHCCSSRYEHTLRCGTAGWRIAGKRITLMNDRIPTMLDFYGV